jgi:hypothetical protein
VATIRSDVSMGSRSNDSKSGPQKDGGFIIDDSPLDPPTDEELQEMLAKEKQRRAPKPEPEKL